MSQRDSDAENFYRCAAQAGFDEGEADGYVEAVIEFLVDRVCRARRAEPAGTAYSDVNVAMAEATGKRELNFNNPAELKFYGRDSRSCKRPDSR